MAIDFTLSPELEQIRLRVRAFVNDVVKPGEAELDKLRDEDRADYIGKLIALRKQAMEVGLWMPHMPKEWGGMGLGHVQLAMVQAEAAKASMGPWVLNCQAPDEGNMHTLLHWGTPEQKEKYLKPLCDGTAMSCFAMTEPEVAGSDPTLIKTTAVQDGDEWVANGHSEIVIEDLRIPAENMLGGRGQGHMLGQYRLGPARLAHCMRWISQAETALDMMVDRSLVRYSHGSVLAEKQGIQWMIADSSMEIYQAKLMVLHAAYLIDSGADFKSEVSMAKHFVANMLGRVIDRSIQVHGALGYSTDTPLAHMFQHARWARFADGADEIHQMRIAQRTIGAYRDHGSTRTATGNLPI